jgi:YidC/Oxa1 family membrane protein insertase
MDRRTLFAFLLIFLIIVGHSVLMKALYGDERSAASADSTSAVTAPVGESAPGQGDAIEQERAAEPERNGAATSGMVVAREGGEEKEPATAAAALRSVPPETESHAVVVQTPLFRAEIAPRGARIVSFELADYRLYNGRPVDLVPSGAAAAAAGADAILFERDSLALGDRVFTAESSPQVTLEPGSDSRRIEFVLRTEGGLEVRKAYTFDPERYGVGVELSVGTYDSERADAALRRLGRPDRAHFGWNQGIAVTERNQKTSERAFRAFARVGDELYYKRRSALRKGVDAYTAVYTGAARFAGLQNKYFTIAGVVPPADSGSGEGSIRLGGDAERFEQTWSLDLPLRRHGTDRGGLGNAAIDLYVGPQTSERLSAYGVGLEDTMDLGWTAFRPLARAVLWIMEQLAHVIPNYGLIIIIFSVLTKLAFYPLTRKSTESMKRMQELQPKIKALQEKYKDNREKQSEAMMKLYREEKINPMAGCLPLLIQMPVFVALYQALMHTIALRQKPFVLWIHDLSQPDALFQLPVSLPFLGSDLNLLPILMSAAMWVQSKLSPTGATGGQMAVMNSLLPVMMLFFFYQMPSGLVLYWLINTVMTIYQTWRIHSTASPQGSVTKA